jgi:hypothetical protein
MIQLIQQSELANHASRKLLKLLNHFTARPDAVYQKTHSRNSLVTWWRTAKDFAGAR